MNGAGRIVEDYLHAFYAGAADVRKLLADDFSFVGPSARFDGADAFLKASAHVAPSVTRVEIDKLFVDGDDVAVFYVLHLDHRVSTIPAAEHFHLKDGRIASSRLVMDTAPFLARSAARQPVDKAIDPVCHMEVDKSQLAATHVHDGVTYYFCSRGCAKAFAATPDEYLAA